MSLLGGLYGRVTEIRRAWYEGQPARARRLRRPVISIGNLVVGGSGKTPLAATLARLLLASGERPSILSRGYGRRESRDGVVVVSDGEGVLACAAESGDEPYMLAQSLSGVPVFVAPDRHMAGSLAEQRFGCSVHVLDDGFQHLQLARDIDLLVMSPGDLQERLLPAGRLREPLSAAARADALIVTGTESEAGEVAATVGLDRVFWAVRSYGSPRPLDAGRGLTADSVSGRAMAVAAIARPDRFFDTLRGLGWNVVCTMAFRDHHWFSARDLQIIRERALANGADVVITTEKDAVRLPADGICADSIPWAVLPLDMTITPAVEFGQWLAGRLEAARRAARERERGVQ